MGFEIMERMTEYNNNDIKYFVENFMNVTRSCILIYVYVRTQGDSFEIK